MVLHDQPPGRMKPYNFQQLLSFFSSRVLHRGPRLLLHLIIGSTLIFATLLVIRRGFGDDLSSSNPFKWTDDKIESLKDESLHYEFQSPQNPGGLRMVVFGGDDVATPAWTRGETEMRSEGWTEVMCRELKCTHYLSFIPPNLHPPAHTFISNAIYVEAVRQTLQDTTTKLKKTKGPGYDYSFHPHFFPVSREIPDLSAQVTAFLELQNSTTFPRANETLYVFSLGQWDVWNLASLPLATGKAVVNQLVAHVVEQIERLYDAATTVPTLPVSGTNNAKLFSREAKKGPMKIVDPEVYQPKAKPITNVSSKSKAPGPKPEYLRVFFPSLFDTSLAPGWNSARPRTPRPHSKAEQMRNAAQLTKHWNVEMGLELYEWVKRSDDIDADSIYLRRDEEGGTTQGGRRHDAEEKRKRAPVAQPKKAQQTERGNGDVVKEGTERRKLVRDFITYDLASYVTTAIVEGQMRDFGLSDGNGLGQQPVEKWYKEVWEPCVKPINSDQETMCNNPDDHLFFTPLTIGSRAIKEIGKEAAEKVRREESVRQMGSEDQVLWEDVMANT